MEEILFSIESRKLGTWGVILGEKILKFRGLKVFIAKIWVYGVFGEINLRATSRFGTEKSFNLY